MHPKPTGAWAVYAAFSEQLDVQDALREQLASTGLSQVHVTADGEIHRIDHPDGKRGNKRLWYVCRHDFAVWGDWSTGEQHNVFAKGPYDPEKARKAREEAERHRREYQLAQARRHAQAAAIAQKKAHRLPSAGTHDYTSRKGLKPLGLRQEGTNLVAFLTDGQGIVGYQTISPTGEKRFLTGTAKQGAYWPLGHVKDYIGVCEGVGTAIAVHMGFGCAVAAAMDAGNLKAVCLSLRKRHPNTPIIVYADNDHGPDNDREDNPGVRLGKEAAVAVGGHCVWPTARLGHKGTDFADLWLECPWYFDAGVAV
jgi:putative DNA primase/helicase